MLFWILLAIFAILIYLFDQHFHSYWYNRGIPFKDPKLLFGELGRLIVQRKCIGEFIGNIYQNHKQKNILGLYFLYRPILVINDPQLIRDVMIKDFVHFHDRGFPIDEEVDPLFAHLLMISGQRWRDLRVKLTPLFSSGKLRGMYPTIRNSAQVFQDFLIKNVESGYEIFDMRDLLARYMINVISSVAFGIENDCINDPENMFRKIGLKVFEPTFKRIFQDTLAIFVPKFILLTKFKQISKEIEDFFMSVVKQTIELRENNKNYDKKDLMQLLIQLKNQGYVSVDKDEEFNFDDKENVKKSLELKKLTFTEVAAQAFLFFVAGFETSSSTSNFCLLELSKNPKIQQKVQNEIDKVMKESNSSEFTYEMLSELKYLECCIDEATRKYPIIPVLNRECSKDYVLSKTDQIIEKGTALFIPVMGLHRDPDLFEDPLQFKPERFSDSSTGTGKSDGLFFLPFGDGPRNCIGARMGKILTKLSLAMILSKFSFKLVDETLKYRELEFNPSQFILTPKETVLLKVTKRK